MALLYSLVVYKSPTNSQKSYEFTNILRLQRNPMTSQTSYEFTNILRLQRTPTNCISRYWPLEAVFYLRGSQAVFSGRQYSKIPPEPHIRVCLEATEEKYGRIVKLPGHTHTYFICICLCSCCVCCLTNTHSGIHKGDGRRPPPLWVLVRQQT